MGCFNHCGIIVSKTMNYYYYYFLLWGEIFLDFQIHLTAVRAKHLVQRNKQRHGEVFKNSFNVFHAYIWSRMKGSPKNSNITSCTALYQNKRIATELQLE